jgi:mitochondrial fission protein ELM1
MKLNVGHLTEGISGHDGQALGVIKNLADSGYSINVTTISVGWRTRLTRGLLKFISRKLSRFPNLININLITMCYTFSSFSNIDIFISSGANLAPLNLALTKKNNAKNIHLSTKRDWHIKDFNAYITTKKISPLKNNLSPDIVPNLFDPAKCMRAGEAFIKENNLHEEKFSLLILGGNGIGYKYDKHEWDEILKNFSDFCQQSNTKPLFITSPRTPNEVESIIQSKYETSFSVLFHSENKRGSFPHLLYMASNIFVTEDSSTMLSEAISAGKRVACIYPKNINAPEKYTEIIRKYEALNFIKRKNINEISDGVLNEMIDITSKVNQSLAEFNKLLTELLFDQ